MNNQYTAHIPFRQVGQRTRCPACNGHGRYIKEYQGRVLLVAWHECFDCDYYHETYRYQPPSEPIFHLRQKS